MNPSALPTTRQLTLAYALSLIVAVLMAAVSLVGLLFPSAVYPTDEMRNSSVPTDMVNLVIALPVLVGSMELARRGRLIGLLFWPGALLYIAYNYIAYTVAMPFTLLGALSLPLVLLSATAIYRLLAGIDAAAVQQRLEGRVSERFTGGILLGFGALFFLMAAGKVVSFLTGQAAIPWPEMSVQIADLLITPAWLVGGILLWRRRALGYVTGAGLLFQASMLFVGLLVFFILQPFVAGVPFPTNDFVVIAVMSLVCLIPFGLFLRGLVRLG